MLELRLEERSGPLVMRQWARGCIVQALDSILNTILERPLCWVQQLCREQRYPGNSYHLIRCNCNHFASDLCRRLGVGDLPAWVERLAWIGESLLEASEGLERFRCVVEDATAVASH
ncbi:unnamed protein product [Durusdinium trenchii]|uniref:PPPDE domain-containing protein n=1 Tax=Durusdinium trenchii TaxID=1381693 RepID=A0ABP0LG37_9DINO